MSLEWGEGPPKPPSRHQGTKYALEWGEDRPQITPSLLKGANFVPRMGEGPPNPPLGTRKPSMPLSGGIPQTPSRPLRAKNTFSQTS